MFNTPQQQPQQKQQNQQHQQTKSQKHMFCFWLVFGCGLFVHGFLWLLFSVCSVCECLWGAVVMLLCCLFVFLFCVCLFCFLVCLFFVVIVLCFCSSCFLFIFTFLRQSQDGVQLGRFPKRYRMKKRLWQGDANSTCSACTEGCTS